jgi:AraC-like DNA-binding protein
MKVKEYSKLYITKGLSFFIGTIEETSKHNHNALQVTLSVNKEFIVEFDDATIHTKSIIINSNCNHKLIGRNGNQILISIENESFYSRAFQSLLEKKSYKEILIDPTFLQNIEREIREKKNLSKTLEKIISYFDIKFHKVSNIDERIKKVISFIDTVEEKKVTIKNLSNLVSLSESRLQHLFKSQIGMSIKRFLQWKKLVDGIHIIAKGKDFTYAAYEAGFSDSAHMSRTFKRMFGIILFDLFHSSRFNQVIVCES